MLEAVKNCVLYNTFQKFGVGKIYKLIKLCIIYKEIDNFIQQEHIKLWQ